MIQADVQWREQYVSHALNRKFTGVVSPGIYQGYTCRTMGGDIIVGESGEPNTAVVESNGYSITVRMTDPERITPTTSRPYVVMEVYYTPGVATRASLKAVAEPAEGHVVLCRVTRNSAGTWDIDISERQMARPIRVDGTLAQMSASQLALMKRQMALYERTESESQASQQRDEALNERVDAEVDALNERVDAEVGALNERVDAEVGALNERVDTTSGALDARITDLHERTTEVQDEHLSAMTHIATNSIDTMARQVTMMGMLVDALREA